jgi:hypothetical protein
MFVIFLLVVGKLIFRMKHRHGWQLLFQRMKVITLSLLLFISTLIVVFGYLGIIHAFFIAPVEQARYFNGFIKTSTTDIFQNEIRDDQIRLVDKELAESIVNRHASLFGSNIKIKSLHITTYQGQLVWVAAMGPDNTFNQELSGVLIINANDPTLEPTKIELTPGSAIVSENLFYGAETRRVAWLGDPVGTSYGRTYITWAPANITHPKIQPGQILQVQTFNKPQLFQWVTKYGGVFLYDLKGTLLETYTDLSLIPNWISQPFDEEWLEYNIGTWGNLRQNTDFNIFAPGFLGFITPSADRLEISRDTRYIISPDTNETVAITPLHPSANRLSSAGIFLSQSNSITYFDYRSRGYVSSESIEQYVESNEPPAAQGEYYATLPMLYPVKVNNETRMAWFTPVYHQTASTDVSGDVYSYNVQFRALYVLDAKKQELYGRAYLASVGGNTRQMVSAAKEAYKQAVANFLTGENQTEVTDYVVANITQKASYVDNGTTFIVFKTNTSLYQYLLASPSNLDVVDWLYALLEVEVGTIVKFKAIQLGNVWQLIELKPA